MKEASFEELERPTKTFGESKEKVQDLARDSMNGISTVQKGDSDMNRDEGREKTF